MVDLVDPTPEQLGVSAEAWLARLRGPTWLHIAGRDRSRCRAVVTLLHGNEPSGIRALHRLLVAGEPPAVDLLCFVGVVQTALGPPPFARRAKPELRDLNRCFRPPFVGEEGRLAQALLERLRGVAPEALVDLHNTSAPSPPYGVTTRRDDARVGLVSHFADHVIVTDQRLGALVEAVEDDFPSVVIECGGAGDPAADQVALAGLRRFASGVPLVANSEAPVRVLEHPIRVELVEGASVAFANAPDDRVDLTLRLDVDRHNFGVLAQGEVLGWTGPRGLDVIVARDGAGRSHTSELFAVRDRSLITARRVRPFMVTTDAAIAAGDCLFYLIEI